MTFSPFFNIVAPFFIPFILFLYTFLKINNYLCTYFMRNTAQLLKQYQEQLYN